MRRPPPVASLTHQVSWDDSKDPVCTLCGRARSDGNRRLIAGPDGVYICICDECIDLCMQTVDEDRRD